MKTFGRIMKILAALAAIAGVIYVVATYGDKIVAWAKGLLGKAKCLCACQCECDGDCDDCNCEGDCDDCQCECACTEEIAEEPAEEAAETVQAEVLNVSLDKPVKEIETTSGTFLARTVMIASGANPKELGLENEKSLTGRGVHYCAACDGMFYRGKTVVVAGGGNSAISDALLLSRLCKIKKRLNGSANLNASIS